jgi:hypothetical protein
VSYSRREGRGAIPPEPPRSPRPPRQPRRGESWAPGVFSPAIFLVALLVIAFLVAAAVFSQRGRVTPTPAAAVGTTAPTATNSGTGSGTGTGPSSGGGNTQATPTTTPRRFVVANTGGDGVYLRRTPRLADRDTAYPDNTQLVAIGDDVNEEGLLWHHVRTSDGKSGYVPAQYTTETR